MPEILTPEVVIEEVNTQLVTQEAAQAMIAVCAPLVPRIEEYATLAANIRVETADHAKQANALMANIRTDIKTIEEALKVHTDEASRRHKLLTGFRGRFVDAFTAAGKQIKAAVMAYDAKVQAAAEAEQRRLQAIADEHARKEREKQEAAARALREKEEAARAAADEARRQAEAASGAERARLEAEARRKEREAAAAQAKAEVRQEAAQNVIAQTITIAAQKSGVRARKDVTVDVLDIVAFVKDAAANPMLCGYIDVGTLAANLKRAKTANPMLSCAGIRFGEKMV